MSKLCDLNTASNWAAGLRVVISARTTPAAPAGAGGTQTSNDAAASEVAAITAAAPVRNRRVVLVSLVAPGRP